MQSGRGYRHHVLLTEHTVEMEEHSDRKQHSSSEKNIESRYTHAEPAAREKHPYPCGIDKLVYQKTTLDMDIWPPYNGIGSYCCNSEHEARPAQPVKMLRGGKHIAADEDRSMAEERDIYLTMRIRSIDGTSGSNHRKIIEKSGHKS